jgi:hypothetical protein
MINEHQQSTDPPADLQARPDKPPVIFLPQSHRTEPILPMDILVAQLGKNQAVIIHYLVSQVTRHVRSAASGFP